MKKITPKSPWLAGFIGTLLEAWVELRTHKLRVTLSLIGIAVAVAALTAVFAMSEIQKQVMLESQEITGGKVATLSITYQAKNSSVVDHAAMEERFNAANKRYGFKYISRVSWVQASAHLPAGVTRVATNIFDLDYLHIHTLPLQTGRWFNSDDVQLLAPAVVISQPLWETLGSPALETHPTLKLAANLQGTYQIIGVTPQKGSWDEEQKISMLFSSYLTKTGGLPADTEVTREIWTNAQNANQLRAALQQDLRATAPKTVQISVNRTDSGADSAFLQMFATAQIITTAISGIVLLLGGLSLVNIQLVAMQQRIREIGVRRSFGASSRRIFFSVMMESVVATAVAGVLGIGLAILLISNPLVQNTFFSDFGLQTIPTFPLSAVLLGLIAAVTTGALAGLTPAIVATRVKVIDAIRF